MKSLVVYAKWSIQIKDSKYMGSSASKHYKLLDTVMCREAFVY